MRRVDDPEAVRTEYADERGLAARSAIYAHGEGPDPRDVALAAVAEASPERVLEVGCGRGELAARMRDELSVEVFALDQSPRMVQLTRARGIKAVEGDVQDLPLPSASVDCVVAAWMLYHVPDLPRALREIVRVLRPGGRLVAVTNGREHLAELWARADAAGPQVPFAAEDAVRQLAPHFARVERRDVVGWVLLPDWEAVRRYVRATFRSHLAAGLPPVAGPLRARRVSAVLVAERA
jgi:SAM-dependent methyltransferase